MKYFIIILVVITLLATTYAFLQNSEQPETKKNNDTAEMQINQNTKSLQNDSLFNEHKTAPELTGITAWLNLPARQQSLTISSLRGKVVLIDFWTNQCINCIHTLSYVTKWYDTYKQQGFVTIGVHTPELASEYTIDSIQRAIDQYNIHYPVAQDNNYKTWNAYNNEYWPAFYLIDKKGIIRRTHFGEGEYNETEQAIETLLAEK